MPKSLNLEKDLGVKCGELGQHLVVGPGMSADLLGLIPMAMILGT
jgi:hypothetical protein